MPEVTDVDKKGSVYTKRAIAQILELSERRIEQLAKEGILEEYSQGHYKLLPTIQSYVNYLRSQIGDDDTYNEERTNQVSGVQSELHI